MGLDFSYIQEAGQGESRGGQGNNEKKGRTGEVTEGRYCPTTYQLAKMGEGSR